MFKKVLIANRGEIALRLIRACRELGIATVAVYSQADATSLHIQQADESVCIGPAPAAASYLNRHALLSTAEVTDADALHPGYGFLAENAEFVEMCQSVGLTFIGPTAEHIRLMGDKARAKETMMEAGVPVVPGSDGVVESAREGLLMAREIGFPVIIKASAGGGGKGMRVVNTEAAFSSAYSAARAEAGAAFGDDRVYLERYVERPRHVEVQVLADRFGNAIHLGERDCSIQRRHQKLLEESPSPFLDEETRAAMAEAAVRAARHVGYQSAGTVEFIVDEGGAFYFMEMNTRIQVEHPVTEMVTGIDLVKEQIRIAAGLPLSVRQSEVTFHGHAIECRVNAEDPVKFTPSPGTIETFIPPGGPWTRVDTACYAGAVIPPYYDSLIAKVIVLGRDRDEAIVKMRRALGEFVVEGVKTTIPLHQRILRTAEFQRGEVYTNFLETVRL
ncbi:MAG: acetyl-CoA carboxylase biotin carboxylase subunit [Nitrospirae bacterium]|nr:MAG: acetyl-CoA carboxylase biotin carboxylase subunit [Nitrospirota bacterium]